MPDSSALRTILKSQYHAALAMLRETIEQCPDDLWLNDEPKNAFWQVAYHALFFTHLYLLKDEASFEGWKGHQGDVQHPDGIPSEPPDPNSGFPWIPRPYTRPETLAYWSLCDRLVDAAVDDMDLESLESGFAWYRMSRFEHQLVNLRHVQHHAAQLADRLRQSLGTGTRWVAAVPSK